MQSEPRQRAGDGPALVRSYKDWKGSNVLVLLLITSGRDPGIVPRNLNPPEPDDYDGSTETGIDLPVVLTVPYAITVCKDLTITVLGLASVLDRFFFMFVFSATLLCIYVHGFCWVYVKMIMNSEDISIWKALIKTPASIVLIIYSFLASWFVGGLTSFHLYLISTNQSTYENFRCRYDGRANPFNKGVIANFVEVFFTSIPPSQNNFRGKIPMNRAQVGNNFDGPVMGKAISDIEMGEKPGWDETARETGDYGGQFSNDDGEGRDNGLSKADVSPDLSRRLPTERHSTDLHPSRSLSWGRRSGSLNISPEVLAMAAGVGDSRQVSIESVAALPQSPDNCLR